MMQPAWLKNEVKGLLLDIYGVLINSTDQGPKLIDGSLEAVKRLKSCGLKLRFCTNESQMSQEKIVERLRNLGFPVETNEIFSPIPAVKKVLLERNLTPYVIVHDNVRNEFDRTELSEVNCVVLGDAAVHFTYNELNNAFRVLLNYPSLFVLGYGKYYLENKDLVLDVGSYSKVLEHACNVTPTIIGKPSADYFMAALKDMDVTPSEAIMIGDDIESDIGGAQNCGIRGVQVRTGKYRPSDEPHCTIVPNGYVNNLHEAVDMILKTFT